MGGSWHIPRNYLHSIMLFFGKISGWLIPSGYSSCSVGTFCVTFCHTGNCVETTNKGKNENQTCPFHFILRCFFSIQKTKILGNSAQQQQEIRHVERMRWWASCQISASEVPASSFIYSQPSSANPPFWLLLMSNWKVKSEGNILETFRVKETFWKVFSERGKQFEKRRGEGFKKECKNLGFGFNMINIFKKKHKCIFHLNEMMRAKGAVKDRGGSGVHLRLGHLEPIRKMFLVSKCFCDLMDKSKWFSSVQISNIS